MDQRVELWHRRCLRQISDLEYECGFKLFDRIGRVIEDSRRLRVEASKGNCLPSLAHTLERGSRVGDRDIQALPRGREQR